MKNLILIAPFVMITTMAMAQDDIADMRANYNVGQSVTVTGIVTNGPELGAIRYIQDETAGVAIYPGQNWNNQNFTPQAGDLITVSGVISEFANLLEVGPTITAMELVSSGNLLPEPIILEPNDLNETYEGMLVQINNAIFSDGGSVFGSSTYNFTSGDQQSLIYVPSASPLLGQLIPLGEVDIIGVLSQFSFDNPDVGYQVLPRTMADFVSDNAVNFTTGIVQENMSTSGFTLSWGTDIPSSTGVLYGLTPNLGEVQAITESVIEHTVTLEGLESGMPYYAAVFSVAGEDTIMSTIRTYTTISESSGTMRVYFNRAVDTTYSTGVNAVSLFSATADTIVSYIDRAQHTLDIAVYNNNNGPIVQAINNALDRGVVVRYIAEGQNANTALASLDASISVLEREDATSSGMHNKFIIVDAEQVDSSWVLTGSTNFTSNNLFSDPNNMVIIQDQALARAYTIEFNEMWGGAMAQPNLSASRFGEFKINNTPEKFIIDGKNVELYFSPSDNTTNAIEKAIQSTDYDLDFALLLITNNILADAIAGEVSIFVTPRGIVESTSIDGSDFDFLESEGVTMISHENVPGQLHHKYAIIDHSQPLSDPMVITGSHNWSSSAESVNDENTLIIHDATVANLYYQEFMALYNGIVSSVEATDMSDFLMYPNPAQDEVTLQFDSQHALPGMISIIDLQGKEIYSQNFSSFEGQNRMRLHTGNLPEGVYVVNISSDRGMINEKLVVVR